MEREVSFLQVEQDEVEQEQDEQLRVNFRSDDRISPFDSSRGVAATEARFPGTYTLASDCDIFV